MKPTRLTVVYDEDCEVCRRCRHWLSLQATHLPVDFLAAGDPAAKDRFGQLAWYRIELMVVADDGRAWVGPAAFIMCLWSTVKWRRTSYRLRSPSFAPLAESFFHGLSSHRSTLSGMLRDHRCDDAACGAGSS